MKKNSKNRGTNTILYIKNMVCDRCIRVVREELLKLGYDVRHVELGEAELRGVVRPKDAAAIKDVLIKNGFDLIENENARIIETVKTAIIKIVHHNHDAVPMKIKHSEYIAREAGKDYHFISTLFSSVENITIERYIIKHKIERVKELMKYGDKTLSEIAFIMNYSSVQHLSNQFKSVTGFTPTQFKKLSLNDHDQKRIPLDKV